MHFKCAAFLFDMDGVLVDSHAVVERTWRRWAQRHQMDPELLIRAAHGRRTRDTLRAVAPHLDLLSEVAWLDAAELADFDGLVAIEGATRFLATLPPHSWGVVTSAGRELAQRRLESAGVPLPLVIVTSEDVTHGKPAPDGYVLGAQRLGQSAASCLVFEDAPPGVAAGRAAGARVVALTTNYSAEALAGADVVVPNFMRLSIQSDGSGFVVEII